MFKGIKNLITGGSASEREVKRAGEIADRIINEISPQYEKLSDEELAAKTIEFRERLDEGETLNDILPEAFAAVREAAWRTQQKRHYKVQLIGGQVLHGGKIAEMKTGEGKTMVATLAAYLNALEQEPETGETDAADSQTEPKKRLGKGVHVVTVNDYLVKRDAQWMGPIYMALGMSVAIIQSNGGYSDRPSAFLLDPTYDNPDPTLAMLRPISRKEAYEADITHGTNNEFGFDYLRDNMAQSIQQCSQRTLNFAIVDEVDNILIDEARTPLIISGPAGKATDDYYKFAELVSQLRPGEERDYTIKEKERTVILTPRGLERVEQMLKIPEYESLYDDKWNNYTVYLDNALRAKALYLRDKEYIVREGEVIIVDEFTGRLMEGRRYEGGLHQAIEAKEKVRIQQESLTYATITLQNYFRMYKKLAGMTGTALTESEEFLKIYGLDVVPIPTNKEMIRDDATDLVYRDEEIKYKAVLAEIEEMNEIGRPVLVGTTSVEKSEYLHELLSERGIRHNVLNAKLHEKEAHIVAQAGRPFAVTIATNMAGRGTDIVLGGSPESYLADVLEERELTEEDAGTEAYQAALDEANDRWQKAHDHVIELGGLHIVGTERHESRRIDNQLRGRAGRQGDPGSSRFYVSLEDELMRRFGSERISGLLDRFGFDEETPIENGLISKTIEQAQTKVEGMNFDFRKLVVEYDNVMNKQREVIYTDRRRVLENENLREQILKLTYSRLDDLVDEYTVGEPADWDLHKLFRNVGLILKYSPLEIEGAPPKDEEELDAVVLAALEKQLELQVSELDGLGRDAIKERLHEVADLAYERKEAKVGPEDLAEIERLVMLETYDKNWVDYLTPMESLRQGIGLRAYGQRDPLQEYKRSAFAMWGELQEDIKREIVQNFWPAELVRPQRAPQRQNLQENMTEAAGNGNNGNASANGNGSRNNGSNANAANNDGNSNLSRSERRRQAAMQRTSTPTAPASNPQGSRADRRRKR